ncbi:FAD-binding Berberine family protein [Euphorbia peplus]|nr:FAD-binding Berberine family protein [Euphorbia peplus]
MLTNDVFEAKTEAFVKCLVNHSDPSYPISPAIYSPRINISSYSSILQSYIRNLRFNVASIPKPFLILTALHPSHVQAAVICAKKHGLQMKIRSGGHDYEGSSYISDVPFFVLDMFNLRKIDVDVENETAWVQTGATLGELYYRIAEKSKVHGFPGGVCPTVGVGGHLSGGGYGNMMRKYGLSADNIIDAQIVNADGKICDRKSMGEDLFWAIRGGGGASFAVVLAYKVNLVRVPVVVNVFRVERTVDQHNVTEIVDQWQHVAYKLEDNLFIRVILDVINSVTRIGEKTIRSTFRGMFLGDSESLISIMDRSFPTLGLVSSDCIQTSWAESVLFWADFTSGTPTTALLSRTHLGVPYLKRKSDYVKEPIPKHELEGIWKKMIELETPQLLFNPYGGRMGEIPRTAIPFPHRAGNLWKIQYLTNWYEGGKEAENHHIDMTRKLYEYMTPFVSKNPRQAFLNYRDHDLGINSHNGSISYSQGRVYGN